MPDEKDMAKLITMVCEKANVLCNVIEGNSVLVSPRKGQETEGVILADVCGNGGMYYNEIKYRDIISGRVFEQDIHVQPYEVMVLEKIG